MRAVPVRPRSRLPVLSSLYLRALTASLATGSQSSMPFSLVKGRGMSSSDSTFVSPTRTSLQTHGAARVSSDSDDYGR